MNDAYTNDPKVKLFYNHQNRLVTNGGCSIAEDLYYMKNLYSLLQAQIH